MKLKLRSLDNLPVLSKDDRDRWADAARAARLRKALERHAEKVKQGGKA